MNGMAHNFYVQGDARVIVSVAKPRLHIGKCSIKQHRTKISKEQREEIIAAIEKKLLEGKTLCKVIHYELCVDGLITEDKNNDELPFLKQSSVAKYIQKTRVKLKINLPLAKNTIIKVYRRMVKLNRRGKRIKISSLAREVGCSAEWARKILKDSNLLTSN